MQTSAQKGAQLLDQIRPDWAREINLDTLNMIEGSYCVLGQLFGEFEDGMRQVMHACNVDYKPIGGADYSQEYVITKWGLAEEYGFHIDRGYLVLQQQWVAEIQARLQ